MKCSDTEILTPRKQISPHQGVPGRSGALCWFVPETHLIRMLHIMGMRQFGEPCGAITSLSSARSSSMLPSHSSYERAASESAGMIRRSILHRTTKCVESVLDSSQALRIQRHG